MSRTKISEGGMPHNFNKVVLSYFTRPFSSAYVTMVRKGKRHNDQIERVIKQVQEKKIFV